MPITYHAGQIEVQTEANTRRAAQAMTRFGGPVGEFTLEADLVVVAAQAGSGWQFAVVSGEPPVVQIEAPATILLPAPLFELPAEGLLVGGIAINLGLRQRARLNGRLTRTEGGAVLQADEAFCNCAKYIAPTYALDETLHVGPTSTEAIDLDDPWLADVVARAETSFLASVSVDGQPDVSHRGGRPGFLHLDVAGRRLWWADYLGNGMFKSAGNIRANGTLSLLVLDLETGDAAQLSGAGTYTTAPSPKRRRLSEDEESSDETPFVVQGQMSVALTAAHRLRGLVAPRGHMGKQAQG